MTSDIIPKILLVDDRQENLEALVNLLSDFDVEFMRAQNGNRALELALKHELALILMDVQMPGMDGFETADILRKNQNTPIIFITAYSREEQNILKGYESGAIDYLVKPLKPDILKSKVSIFLSIYRKSKELALANNLLKGEIERREAIELELRNARDLLEVKVKERTTQLEEAFNNLKTSQGQIQLVINNIPLMVAFINQDKRYEFANQPYKIMVGIDENIIGKQINEVMKPEVKERCGPLIDQAINGIQGAIDISEKISPDETRHYHLDYIPYITNQENKGCFVVIRDITKEKEERERVEQINAQERQLRKLKSLATLSGGVAHEFNNLLVPIIGFSKMVKKKLPADAAETGYMDRVISAANRAKEIVAQIRVFSRKRETKYASLDLNKIAKKAVENAKQIIPNNIALTTSYCDTCVEILGSSDQVYQIIQNLIENSLEAMPDGGDLKILVSRKDPSLYMRHVTTSEHQAYISFEVVDSGCGMPAEVKEQMFDPFFTTKEKGIHVGLGLSVVLGIVEQMDGMIHVDSSPDKGSHVIAFFPQIAPGSPNESTSPPEKRGASKKNILIIDDEETILRYCKQSLELEGHKVTVERHPSKGMELFSQYPETFDTVIVDYMMPNITGIDLIKAMKEVRNDLQFIICSAFIDEEKEQRIRTVGHIQILKKPFYVNDIEELLI